MSTLKAEDFQTRDLTIEGWQVRVTSYRLGDRFSCNVDGVDSGARIARGTGATREEAERTALEKTERRLAATRRFPA